MGYLTKEQLLAIHRRQTVEVDAPEMEGTILVRKPSAAATDRLGLLYKSEAPQAEVFAEVLRAVCVTEDLQPMFTTRAEAADALEWLPMTLVTRIAGTLSPAKAPPVVESTPDGETITSIAEPDPGNG